MAVGKTRVAKKAPAATKEATPKKLGKLEKQVWDLSGKEVGVTKLPEEVFGAKVNEALLSQALRVYSANIHQGTRSTKTRAEVRGGGRKPWKQKGTGRARQGSIRAPHWRGGGITFGPKPTDPRLNLPEKMRKAALKSALSSRVEDLMIVSEFKMTEPKTKKIAQALKKLNISGRTLFVLPEHDEKVARASRNIEAVRLTRTTDLNAWEILAADKVVLAQDSLAKLAEVAK